MNDKILKFKEEIKGKKVSVIGMGVSNIPAIKYLQKLQSTDISKASTVSHINVSKTRNVKPEINIIGLNVDEATFVVDKFLDDCALAKLETVRIVHGKGTGKLRDGVHKFLKSNPHVKSFRMGTYGEGEMGVTVVTLK